MELSLSQSFLLVQIERDAEKMSKAELQKMVVELTRIQMMKDKFWLSQIGNQF